MTDRIYLTPIVGAYQIRMARVALNLSQAELAKRCDVSVSTVRRMESSEIGPSRSSQLALRRVEQFFAGAGARFLTAGEYADPRDSGSLMAIDGAVIFLADSHLGELGSVHPDREAELSTSAPPEDWCYRTGEPLRRGESPSW